MIKQEYDRIRDYIAGRREELTEDLRALVRVPSISAIGIPEPGAPYGRECARALETAKQIFAAHGIASEIWTESGYLIADVGQGERCFGLFGHSDVVPVDDAWTLGTPFCADVREGCVIGRGARDDKSGIIASLYAVEAIRDLGIPFGSRIRIVVGSSEENTMPDMRRFAAEQPMPDVSIVPDTGYPVIRGEKGILRVWGVSKGKLSAVRDLSGGEAPNVVLGKAQARFGYSPALERALGGFGEAFALAREGDELVLTATGISKHAAHPEGSANAGRMLIAVLAGCSALPEGDRAVLARAADLLEGYYGEGLRVVHTDPDFGKLTCSNGMIHVQDGRLALSFDIRYGAGFDGGELVERIRTRMEETDYSLERVNRRDGFIIPKDDPALRTLLACYAEVTGVEAPESKLSGGGTYARELKHAFSTAPSAPRPCPFQLPAGHGGAHQPDEYIPIDGVVDGAAMLAAMLLSLDRMEP